MMSKAFEKLSRKLDELAMRVLELGRGDVFFCVFRELASNSDRTTEAAVIGAVSALAKALADGTIDYDSFECYVNAVLNAARSTDCSALEPEARELVDAIASSITLAATGDLQSSFSFLNRAVRLMSSLESRSQGKQRSGSEP